MIADAQPVTTAVRPASVSGGSSTAWHKMAARITATVLQAWLACPTGARAAGHNAVAEGMTYQRAMLALGNGDRLRGMQVMFMLAARLEHARGKHPWPQDALNQFAAFRALGDECEEVNRALCMETPDRVRDELLDVIAVAVRMLLGECRGGV